LKKGEGQIAPLLDSKFYIFAIYDGGSMAGNARRELEKLTQSRHQRKLSGADAIGEEGETS
jgi:hypothetical protein